MAAYLGKYGPLAIDHGYEIVAIRPGTKRPFGDEWETKVVDKRGCQARPKFGCGIKTRLTPAVDIDVFADDLVAHMIAFTEELVGPTLERVGLPPKTLLVYRSLTPFRKVNSPTFIDSDGNRNKLEVLGDGQQFVAFAVHPDTKQPYRWADKQTPHNTPAADLRVITREQAEEIAAEFARQAESRGWKKASANTSISNRRDVDLDDAFIGDKQKVDLSVDALRDKLSSVPGAEDYDTWRDVGMALWHQFDGSEEGSILWHEWSSQASNYDMDALDAKWPTFDHEGKGREPVTARLILKLATKEEQRLVVEALDDSKRKLFEATDLSSLREVCEEIKHIAFDQPTRDLLVAILRKRLTRITGEPAPIATARAMIRYENPDNKHTPKWLEGWVYIDSEERFYHVERRAAISAKAFDASFNRYMMTKKDRLEGRSFPENSASHVALNRHEIPVVMGRRYMPGEDDLFRLNGIPYVNTYTDIGVPEEPEEFTKGDKRAIRLIEGHLDHLFSDKRSATLLLDFISFIVRSRSRLKWAPVIQGAEGDGKTFFYHLVAGVVGAENAAIIGGETLEEKFTSWAEGSLFTMIEEVRLHGKNRFDVVNKMKPYITNFSVPIRRMQTSIYSIINQTSYILTTNSKDGVPVGSGDTRYFPMFSRWQRREDIDAFNAANPSYYDDLYAAVEKHGGALRKWLRTRELSKEFNPKKRAPISAYRDEMIALNKSDEDEAFELALSESKRLDFCETLLDSALCDDMMSEHGGSAPFGRWLAQFLSAQGFTRLGRVSIDGEARRLWSRKPAQFVQNGVLDTNAVRNWLEPL